MRHMYRCKVGLCIVEGLECMQLELCGLHDRQSHVAPPRRSLLGSIDDNNIPPELIDSGEADEEEEDDDDNDNDNDDDDDDDSRDDNAFDEVEY